ncbi:hypothetical protein L2E82_32880 [Cichorium intybus]|uniref:Uncharacterized protein n=1 Tax=Cichorium intybus TaxID=13427 RepID=A0ACB9BIS1_CICIN|nr:hypothetical protein L2E82_32880 [Cichorium intybus]
MARRTEVMWRTGLELRVRLQQRKEGGHEKLENAKVEEEIPKLQKSLVDEQKLLEEIVDTSKVETETFGKEVAKVRAELKPWEKELIERQGKLEVASAENKLLSEKDIFFFRNDILFGNASTPALSSISGAKTETSSLAPARSSSTDHSGDLSMSNASHLETEWVKQDELGVYISIGALPGGNCEVFAYLLFDPQQILKLTVVTALTTSSYEIEVYSLEDGPVHTVWKKIGVSVSIVEADKKIMIDRLNYDAILVNSLEEKEAISGFGNSEYRNHVSNGEASSSVGPSNSKLVQHFLGMGFSDQLIAKAIKENDISFLN